MKKTIALRIENVSFCEKPSLYALKTLNFKLTLPSLGFGGCTVNTQRTEVSQRYPYIYNWNLAQLYMEVRQQAYIRPTERKTERQKGIEEYDTKNRDILYQIKT